ncbi:MAG: hypothetical protein JWQ02_1760 [Capsulimonas sp.]|jgi:hypothetical protein|nr:hypothetical protein [Capsulimonas sp.]
MSPLKASILTVIECSIITASTMFLTSQYAGARHYSCGTPALMIEQMVFFGTPLALVVPLFGYLAARGDRLPALTARWAVVVAVVTWIGSIVTIARHGTLYLF